LKYLVGMSYETFWRISQFGILIVLVVIQIDQVKFLLRDSTIGSVQWMARLFRVPMG
jgi:hypothetical protein